MKAVVIGDYKFMKIALMCPSRQRLNKILTFISSIITTVDDINNINLVLGVDEDDPKFKIYNKISNNLNFIQFVPIPAGLFKERGLSGLWNYMYTKIDSDIIAMVGDDMMFETAGWDTAIINEFNKNKNKVNDNFIMIHCNDGMRGQGNKYTNVAPLAVNSFVHRDYTELIGHYVEDIEPNIYEDTFIHAVFEALNRRIYRHDIMIRHLHFSEGGKCDDVSTRMEKLREGVVNDTVWSTKIVPEIKREVELIKSKIK